MQIDTMQAQLRSCIAEHWPDVDVSGITLEQREDCIVVWLVIDGEKYAKRIDAPWCYGEWQAGVCGAMGRGCAMAWRKSKMASNVSS